MSVSRSDVPRLARPDENTKAGRTVVEAATADLVAADFALGALDRDQLRQLSSILRPVREAAGDF